MIIGAGLTGLIAAHMLPGQRIIEKNSEPREGHKAVLRFRTPDISRITGIDFERVRMHKGIWFRDAFVPPTVQVANMYSYKVTKGRITDRSIWNQEPDDRYIAPPDFFWRLVDGVKDRIEWGVKDFDIDEPVISTIPMPVMLNRFGIEAQFSSFPIVVYRAEIENCDVHQTIYYPDPDCTLYRATITGNVLIAEFMGGPCHDHWANELSHSFALNEISVGTFFDQRMGKIAPIDESFRRAAISTLTEKHNVYSLGRFATWRPVMLDDIVNDVSVIKKLMGVTAYERRLASIRKEN